MKRKRGENSATFCSVYATDLGCGGIVSGSHGLMQIFIPESVSAVEMKSRILGLYPLASGENELTRTASDLLARYFSGERVRFDLPLGIDVHTSFRRQVYEAVFEIPYGSVRTYKDIAESIERPGAARGIGSAMAANLLPIVVPCHRVVGSGGAMTGYSAPGGTDMKMLLLRMEGVRFVDGSRKVDLSPVI